MQRIVPPGEQVVAIGHAGDVEISVGIGLAYINGAIAILQVRERHPGIFDRSGDLGAVQTAPGAALVRQAVLLGQVDGGAHDGAADTGGGQISAGQTVLRPHIAKHGPGEGFAGDDKFVVRPVPPSASQLSQLQEPSRVVVRTQPSSAGGAISTS